MEKHYDVITIGSGPGGYIASIRCAQLGFSTLCIEKCGLNADPVLGGTCLNVGCIPSKALLDSSYQFLKAKNELELHGIHVDKPSLDLIAMQKRKEKVVSKLTSGVKGLFKLNRIDSLQGEALVEGEGVVSVRKPDDSQITFTTNNIIIATGSIPQLIPDITLDRKLIVTSTEALKFKSVPKRLAVVGAGFIGLELGSVWSRLGSEVVILEELKDFLPSVDNQLSSEALNLLSNQGLDIRLSTKVTGAEISNNEVIINLQNEINEKQLIVDKVIIAIGRKPFTEKVLGPNSGVALDEKGFIKVNSSCETNISNIYAIGDSVRGPMLAHKASEEGIMVAEIIAGESLKIDYEKIPVVIYTHPEIAWAGLTEYQAKEKGIVVRAGVFPFSGSGRALASGKEDGFVKLLTNKIDDSIVGIHVIGPAASDIVQQGVIAMKVNSTAADLASTMFSHPTFSESLHEAALAVNGRAIHISNRQKNRED